MFPPPLFSPCFITRRASSSRCRRSNEAQERRGIASRKAIGFWRGRYASYRLARGETRENYGKICFITSVRNAYGCLMRLSLSLPLSLSLLFSRFVSRSRPPPPLPSRGFEGLIAFRQKSVSSPLLSSYFIGGEPFFPLPSARE